MQPRTSLTTVVSTSQKYLLQAMFIAVSALIAAASCVTASAGNLDSSYDMNVLVIKYIHINQSNVGIDPKIAAGGWWRYQNSYVDTLKAVNDQISAMRTAAENGSAYLGYKDALAQPALRYRIVDTKEYIKPVPFGAGGYVNYQSIMTDHNICDYVNYKGVREVWILKGRHQSGFNHWESFMQSPIEIVGNPSVTENVPLCNHSYRIYTHTYDREELFPEVWSHQIEAELERVSRSKNGPDLFRLFNAPCHGNGDYSCAPRDRALAGLTGEYFNNTTLTGKPVFTRIDGYIDFNWENASPDPSIPASQFPADGFSVRWTGQVVAPRSEIHTFHVTADDGVRLWVGGQLLIDQWHDQPPTEYSASVALTANQPYQIKLEYYENGGGAAAHLRWSSPSMGKDNVPQSRLSPLTASFAGLYFNNMTLTGTPILTRTDPTINFFWGDKSPDPSISVDGFSARWTGQIIPTYSETYDFYTNTDDGVRLRVDGQLIIDQWHDQAAEHKGSIPLLANQPYNITMEYFENVRDATAQLLQWRSPSTHKHQVGRCGNAHTAPNGRFNYDRWNSEPNFSDCTEWNPDGIGPLSLVSCSNWIKGCGKESVDPSYIFDNAFLNYTQWHWQNMPGRNNVKTYRGTQLRNWWDVHGNFDLVMACDNNKTLLVPTTPCTADVAIKLLTEGALKPGATDFYYTASVINNGTGRVVNGKYDPVANGKVNVSLHPGSTFVANNSSPACTASGLMVTCDVGVLLQGQTREFRLNVIPPNVSSMVASATAVLPDAFQDTTPGNDSASVTTVVTTVPTITSFSPIFGQRDTIVTVYGTNFVPGTGQTAVSLNGVDAPIMQVVSPEILFFLAPKNATTGKIKVTTPSGSVESATDFIVSCTLSNPITRILTLGTGTGPTNEEIQVTFTGHIANAAALTANPPTTGVLYICAGTTVDYVVTATKGSLSCQRNSNRSEPNGSLRVNDSLTCKNITGGGGDVDKFFVRSHF